MPGLSDYLNAHVLNWLRGEDMPSAPPALYVGLFNGDDEVTTTIRPAGRVVAAFAAPAGAGMASNAPIDFGLSAGVATITHFGLFDAAQAGNQLGSAAIDAPLAILPGVDVEFAAGALTVGFV